MDDIQLECLWAAAEEIAPELALLRDVSPSEYERVRAQLRETFAGIEWPRVHDLLLDPREVFGDFNPRPSP